MKQIYEVEEKPFTSSLVFCPEACCRKGYGHRAGDTSPPHDQREGMGQLEDQDMPSLRDVAHDGWLCTFTM